MGRGCFFDSQGDSLYGFIHPAEGGPRQTGVVFVHGAFEERQDAHLVVRDAAERLAARGFNVLRFDLYGHGDSAGEYADATLGRWVLDVVAACDALRAHTACASFALVGLRLGGAVAARAARVLAARGTPAALVLWQPVTRGLPYAMEVLRAHLAQEMVARRRAGGSREEMVARLRTGQTVNVFGYPFTPRMFEEICALDVARELVGVAPRVLVVDVVRAEGARGSPELDSLVTLLGPRARLARVVEAQPLCAEGKLFYARSERVSAVTLEFLSASP